MFFNWEACKKDIVRSWKDHHDTDYSWFCLLVTCSTRQIESGFFDIAVELSNNYLSPGYKHILLFWLCISSFLFLNSFASCLLSVFFCVTCDRYQQKEPSVVNNDMFLCKAMFSMAVIHGQAFLTKYTRSAQFSISPPFPLKFTWLVVSCVTLGG